jgi:hypothetical protein
MSVKRPFQKVALLRVWPSRIRSAICHVIRLARCTAVYTQSWASDSANACLQMQEELARAARKIAHYLFLPRLHLPNAFTSS